MYPNAGFKTCVRGFEIVWNGFCNAGVDEFDELFPTACELVREFFVTALKQKRIAMLLTTRQLTGRVFKVYDEHITEIFEAQMGLTMGMLNSWKEFHLNPQKDEDGESKEHRNTFKTTYCDLNTNLAARLRAKMGIYRATVARLTGGDVPDGVFDLSELMQKQMHYTSMLAQMWEMNRQRSQR